MKRRWFALDEERGRLTVKMTAKMMLPMQHQSQEKPKRGKPKRGMPKKRRGKVISAAWSIPSLALESPLQSRHHLLLHAHAHAPAPGTPTTTYFCLTSDEEMMDPGNRMRIILPSRRGRGRRTRCTPWCRSGWGRPGGIPRPKGTRCQVGGPVVGRFGKQGIEKVDLFLQPIPKAIPSLPGYSIGKVNQYPL